MDGEGGLAPSAPAASAPTAHGPAPRGRVPALLPDRQKQTRVRVFSLPPCTALHPGRSGELVAGQCFLEISLHGHRVPARPSGLFPTLQVSFT